jgi:hypothetical protein
MSEPIVRKVGESIDIYVDLKDDDGVPQDMAGSVVTTKVYTGKSRAAMITTVTGAIQPDNKSALSSIPSGVMVARGCYYCESTIVWTVGSKQYAVGVDLIVE